MLVLRKYDGGAAATLVPTVAPALVFSILMVMMQGAFGLYRRDHQIGVSAHAGRPFLAILIAAPIADLIVVRHLAIQPVRKLVLRSRMLALGTGLEARLVEASLSSADPAECRNGTTSLPRQRR